MTELTHVLDMHGRRSVILQIVSSDDARVPDGERLALSCLAPGVDLLVARFGFRETVSIPVIAAQAAQQGLGLDLAGPSVVYCFSRVTVTPGPGGSMGLPFQRLFASMQRAAEDTPLWFQAPLDQVITVGTVIGLGADDGEAMTAA